MMLFRIYNIWKRLVYSIVTQSNFNVLRFGLSPAPHMYQLARTLFTHDDDLGWLDIWMNDWTLRYSNDLPINLWFGDIFDHGICNSQADQAIHKKLSIWHSLLLLTWNLTSAEIRIQINAKTSPIGTFYRVFMPLMVILRIFLIIVEFLMINWVSI
jgi:hypothetical protein